MSKPITPAATTPTPPQDSGEKATPKLMNREIADHAVKFAETADSMGYGDFTAEEAELVCRSLRYYAAEINRRKGDPGTRLHNICEELGNEQALIEKLARALKELNSFGLCEAGCEGRCQRCPADVVREALQAYEEVKRT